MIEFCSVERRSWLRAVLLGAAVLGLGGCGGGGGTETASGQAGGAPAAQAAVPVISTQPQALTVKSGQTATFTVGATGDGPFSYRWQRNGADVDGATAANYSFSASQTTDDQAVWTVRVSNAAGSVTSQPARLTVRSAQADTLSLVAGDITLAWDPNASYDDATLDGAGAQARFDSINGMVVDGQGQVYVAEYEKIRKISAAGEVTTIAGRSSANSAGEYADGTGAAAVFRGALDIALGPDGNLYVADSVNFAIRKVTPAGVVTTVAGGPHAQGYQDGPVATAKFERIQSIAVDSGGSVYVLHNGEIGSGAGFKHGLLVRKITPQGQVTTVPGGLIDSPDVGNKLAVDASGNILVAVNKLFTAGFCFIGCASGPQLAYVVKITPSGEQSVLAGSKTQTALQGVDGAGGEARFVLLHAIAVDASNGDLYVTDSHKAGSVRKITREGMVTTVVGSLQNYGDNYARTVSIGTLPGRVVSPNSVALSSGGDLYLTSGRPSWRKGGATMAEENLTAFDGKVVLKAVLR